MLQPTLTALPPIATALHDALLALLDSVLLEVVGPVLCDIDSLLEVEDPVSFDVDAVEVDALLVPELEPPVAPEPVVLPDDDVEAPLLADVDALVDGVEPVLADVDALVDGVEPVLADVDALVDSVEPVLADVDALVEADDELPPSRAKVYTMNPPPSIVSPNQSVEPSTE
jgi:hypothetical protein